MNSIFIVRHGPCYVEKIKALPTSYTMDNGGEASAKVISLNATATDLCKYYIVVALNSEKAESIVEDWVGITLNKYNAQIER